MFIITAKLRKKRLVAGAAVLLCAVAVIGGFALTRDSAVTTAATGEKVKTNEDRVAYLESYGWQVETEPLAVEELLIPEEFDESYTDYLALQSQQGFDLTEYAGKRVKRYTYAVTNYPTGEENVQIGLLIYKNTVIGGDVLSAELDGFIHGLDMPS